MSTTTSEVIKTAASQIGKYFPNTSPYGIWYAAEHGDVYRGAQFCAMGLSWCFAQRDALDIFPKHAYTPSGANWFKARGRWHTGSINNIKRGDILYFDFPGFPYRISHVGIAEKDGRNGRVQTIEFNTSGRVSGDQRNGRVVARKIRTGHIVGWGRPDYEAPKRASKGKVTIDFEDFSVTMNKLNLSSVVYGKRSTYVYGDHVDNMQALLVAAGYKIAIDGVGGPDTKEALGSFQVKKDVGDGRGRADYIVGKNSWKALIQN